MNSKIFMITLVILMSSSLWLSACENSDDEFSKVWTPIIAYLETGKSFAIIDASVDINEWYKQEIAHITKDFEDNKSRGIEKKKFFHDAITEKNKSIVPQGLTRGSNHRRDAEDALRFVMEKSVSAPKNIANFEEGDQIGFCFGRALMLHYLLLRAGVLPKDLAKIFAVGTFNVGDQFWRFHVAVMVNAEEGLLIVDPLYGNVATLDEWTSNVSSLDINYPYPRARFYITDAKKFMPQAGVYDLSLMGTPALKAYFFALGREIHDLEFKE